MNSRTRLVALDVARFVAIVGMIAAHTHLIPIPGPSLLIDGPPAALFAVLGGASAVLATARVRREAGPLSASAGLAARGLVLVAIGVALELLPGSIVPILVQYGATLIVLATLIHLPSRALVVIAAVLAVVGPIANVAIRDAVGASTVGALSFASPADFLLSVAVTSTYPVVTWLVYLLVGVVLIRAIRSSVARGTAVRFGRRLALGGLLASIIATVVGVAYWQVAVLPTLVERGLDPVMAQLSGLLPGFGAPMLGGLDAVLTAGPHSGATLDLVRTIGVAVVVIGLLLARTQRSADLDRPVGPVARTVRAAGAAPLTSYVLHVASFGAASVLAATQPDGPLALLVAPGLGFLIQVALILVVGVVLARLRRRGPLEAFASTVADGVSRLVRRRPA